MKINPDTATSLFFKEIHNEFIKRYYEIYIRMRKGKYRKKFKKPLENFRKHPILKG